MASLALARGSSLDPLSWWHRTRVGRQIVSVTWNTARLGLHLRRRQRGIRGAEKLEPEGQRDRVDGRHDRQTAPHGLSDFRSRGAFADAEETARELHDRVEGEHAPVGERAGLVERHTAGALDELVTQAAFPAPGSPVTTTTVGRPDSASRRALSSSAISRSRPTKREKPRARERSKRLRIGPGPRRSNTRTGTLAPFRFCSPRSRRSKNPDASRAVCSVTLMPPGGASCGTRAASPTTWPCAV